MKPGKIIGLLLGLALMGFAIGAYFSNEAASKTQQGRVAIVIALIFGFLSVVSNLASAKPKTTPILAIPTPIPASIPLCPHCSKPVLADYVVCPYCQKTLKPKCPKCGKDVSDTFNLCPYCGTELKH